VQAANWTLTQQDIEEIEKLLAERRKKLK